MVCYINESHFSMKRSIPPKATTIKVVYLGRDQKIIQLVQCQGCLIITGSLVFIIRFRESQWPYSYYASMQQKVYFGYCETEMHYDGIMLYRPKVLLRSSGIFSRTHSHATKKCSRISLYLYLHYPPESETYDVNHIRGLGKRL
jgi:hypothetical protein